MFVPNFDVCGLSVHVNGLMGPATIASLVSVSHLNLFLLVLRLYYIFCFPSSIGASVSFEILFILFIVCIILSISGKACRTPGLAVRKLVLVNGS